MTVPLIQPLQQDEAFLADVSAAREPRLWWLGQSGFLLHFDGAFALLDPYLSDSLTRKYAATSRPHVRMTERVIDPARLRFVSVVSSSHNHTDHLDAETILAIQPQNLVIPEANRDFVAGRLRCDRAWPLGLNEGQSAAVGLFTFHALASAHEALDPDHEGRYPYLGYVVEFGGRRIYHSGDCVLYDGLAEKLRAFAVDVALLPINGSRPERHVAGNFWGREAAWLAHSMGARLVIPCHYGMFEFNTESPEEFAASCRQLGQPFRILQNGEGFSL